MDKKAQEIRKNFMKKKRAAGKGYIDKRHEQDGGESYMQMSKWLPSWEMLEIQNILVQALECVLGISPKNLAI